MNARPDAWLRQAQNDLELAQLARDNSYWRKPAFTHHKQPKKA